LPPAAPGLSLQGDSGKSLTVVRFGHHAPMRADTSSFRDKQNAAEKIWLYVEPVEAVHIARQIDAAEMYSVHGASLTIVAALTL